jgi:hypothetical protein
MAWKFVALSLLAALGCLVVGLAYPPMLGGLIFIFSALFYFLGIRWVDRNGQWN